MNKRIKELSKKLKEIFTLERIEEIARKTNFVQRKGKLPAEEFISLCIFLGDDLCTASLTQLCTRLLANESILISPEGLNKRFNENAEAFMKEIFKEMLKKQNEILAREEKTLNTHFNRIKAIDSTSFKLPKEFEGYYRGCGGSKYTDSAVKIQLEYNLKTGEFLHCEVLDGNTSDAWYIPILQHDIKPKDLCLKDLGYFKIKDLMHIDKSKAYYLSRLKSNVNVYIKKENEYHLLDIQKLAEPLPAGETTELEVYLSSTHKLKSRLIITKLTEENKRKKQEHQKRTSKKKQTKLDENSEKLASINVYVTNIDKEILEKEKVYELYSLRWQIEIMFKIWKSLFKIHIAKKVKIERFNCYLYGKLITLLLTSSIVFTVREAIFEEHNKEVSEYKSFSVIREYLPNIRNKIFKGETSMIILFNEILYSIFKYGRKSKRKGKKMAISILNGIDIKEDELELLAI